MWSLSSLWGFFPDFKLFSNNKNKQQHKKKKNENTEKPTPKEDIMLVGTISLSQHIGIVTNLNQL